MVLEFMAPNDRVSQRWSIPTLVFQLAAVHLNQFHLQPSLFPMAYFLPYHYTPP